MIVRITIDLRTEQVRLELETTSPAAAPAKPPAAEAFDWDEFSQSILHSTLEFHHENS